ncbi:MAG: hypothetical protein DME00_22925 [Candidatus Rokuibacteriota bacterium]|nr:MAG: hypothetical protein DME00_22925 [Candidatus Rokubacteria bacterium]
MFQGLARSELSALGISGLPLVTIEHPLGGERREGDLARLARATTDWLSEQVCQLVDGLASSSGDAFATLAAERMLDRDERKPGDTERGELARPSTS